MGEQGLSLSLLSQCIGGSYVTWRLLQREDPGACRMPMDTFSFTSFSSGTGVVEWRNPCLRFATGNKKLHCSRVYIPMTSKGTPLHKQLVEL
eukprot:scaffold80362_cov15-Tisochrysis_lutea.AAC.1